LPEQEFNPLNRFNRPQGLFEIQRTLFCRLKDIPYFCKQIEFILRNIKPFLSLSITAFGLIPIINLKQ